MADNREIVKGARALARDPMATKQDLRGALKGMLSLYDEMNATTFGAGPGMVSTDPAPHAAKAPVITGQNWPK